MVLDYLASFSCLGSSNFNSVYLFLFPKNPPWDFRTKKLVLNTHEKLQVLLTQSKKATVKITIWTKPLKRKAFQVTLWYFWEYFFNFFVKPAVQVHFLSEMSENIRKKCDRRVAKGAGCFFRQLSSAAAFVMMIELSIDWWHAHARFSYILSVGQRSDHYLCQKTYQQCVP